MTATKPFGAKGRRGGEDVVRVRRVAKNGARPSVAQRKYLLRGLNQPGGKLPLFDDFGQEIDVRTVHSCIKAGWAEPWFANPIKPDWLVCKLTESGRLAVDPDV